LDICAACGGTFSECIHEFGGGGAHVTAHQNSLTSQAEHINESGAGCLHGFSGNGLAHDTANIVGFERVM